MLGFFGILIQGVLGWCLFYVIRDGVVAGIIGYAFLCAIPLIGFSIAKRSGRWGFLFGMVFCLMALISIGAQARWPQMDAMIGAGVIAGSIECIMGTVVGHEAGKSRRRRDEVLTHEPSSDDEVEEASDIVIQIGDEQTHIGTMNREATGTIICPVCQSGFVSEEKTISCPKCGVKHHKECWKMIGGCSTFGCKRS